MSVEAQSPAKADARQRAGGDVPADASFADAEVFREFSKTYRSLL